MDLTRFYKNKNILITGGTGNIGKALVGKILNSFPEIGTIYLLVRAKKGKSATQRSKEYLNDDALVHLKQLKQNVNEKIVWLEGDVTKIKLGLSEKSIELIRRHVNIIFHSAASVQLAEKLKTGIIINIKGTRELLNIAETCLNLDCFMHISTTYTNARKTVRYIEEKYYKHPLTPQELLDLAERKSVEELEEESTRLLNNDWLLIYTYTKNAAENLVKQYESKFKIGIFRPGVVVESLCEPFPYCGKNTSVIATILRMAAKGYIMENNPSVQSNCVPMDFTINAILAATQDTCVKNLGITQIYNYTSNNNPISFTKSIKYYLDGFEDPKNFSELTKDKIDQHMNNLQICFENRRSNTRWEKYEHLKKLILFFMTNSMYFDQKNIDKVWNNLSNEDKKKFYFNVNTVDWKLFYRNMYMKKFLKEEVINKDTKQDLHIKNKL